MLPDTHRGGMRFKKGILLAERYFFFAAAQRLRCASAMRARPSAEILWRLRFAATGAEVASRRAPVLPRRCCNSAIAAVIRACSAWYPSNAASRKELSKAIALEYSL